MWNERVRAYLRDQKISQETFAESLGVTQGWLSHKLTGKRKATVDDLSIIAKKMGIPVSDLLESPQKVSETQGEYHTGESASPDDLLFTEKYRVLDDEGKKAISLMMDALTAREAKKE